MSTIEFWRKNLEGLVKLLMRQTGESSGPKNGKKLQIKNLTCLDIYSKKNKGPVARTYRFFSGLIWRLIFMKAIGDTNEAYVEEKRGFCKRCFGCSRYNKKDIKRKKLKNIWDR